VRAERGKEPTRMNSRSMSAGQWLAVISLLGTMSIVSVRGAAFEIVGNSAKPAVMLNSPSQNQYSTAELFSRLMKHRRWQESKLQRFSVTRTYQLENDKGKALSQEVVLMEYKTPGTKTFTTASESGSSFIRGHVFEQIMKREAERAKGHQDQDSSITPDNYALEIVGQDRVGNTDCIVVHAIPKRREIDLFEGNIWIGNQDFAIVKAAGHLAKSPSPWIKRVAFVRQYQKIDGFWLPLREQSTAKIRIYGTRILTIDYRSYTFDGVGEVRPLFSWTRSTSSNLVIGKEPRTRLEKQRWVPSFKSSDVIGRSRVSVAAEPREWLEEGCGGGDASGPVFCGCSRQGTLLRRILLGLYTTA
jgi:hypothetical protein